MMLSVLFTSRLFSRHGKKRPRCAQAVKLLEAIWYFYIVFCTSFRLCVPIFIQIGRQELYFFAFRKFEKITGKFHEGIDLWGPPLPTFKIDDVITRTKMSEWTQIFLRLLLTTKWTNGPSFAKIRQREIYDDILTPVIRFMGGLLPNFLRHVTVSLKIFFHFFPPRFRRGKKRNTSNRFFIESKWKLPKK